MIKFSSSSGILSRHKNLEKKTDLSLLHMWFKKKKNPLGTQVCFFVFLFFFKLHQDILKGGLLCWGMFDTDTFVPRR